MENYETMHYTTLKRRFEDAGYCLIEGAYYNTGQDCAGRWYVHVEGNDLIDKRGPGYRTKREAMIAAMQDEQEHARWGAPQS